MENINYDDSLKAFREELIKINEKSNDNFEKQLSYISAGSLGGSMVIIEKIFKDINSTEYKGLLIFGWVLLGGTLLLNMFSHLYASRLHNKTIKEINDNHYNFNNAVNRNKKISNFNGVTLTALLIGIAFLLFYTSYNILNMKNDKPNYQPDQTKGLPSSQPPPQPIYQPKPETGQPSSPPPPVPKPNKQ
ncbi:MAG: hypothetical protein JST82_03830 [Bacteroidetes bacterium]|nr:hypothetical protein [Bacteroidota bacterium]